MLFSSFEQQDGSFGGGAAAASAGTLLARAGPPLLVLLPAVAGTAAAGGGLGGAELPAPLAWGVLAAALATSGSGSVLDQLLWRPKVRRDAWGRPWRSQMPLQLPCPHRGGSPSPHRPSPQVPAMHTLAAAGAGAALAVVLHKQLAAWASSSAAAVAAKLLAGGGAVGKGHGGDDGEEAQDVEALEYASLYQQHHLHHHVQRQHPGAHAPPPASHPMHLDPFQQRVQKQLARAAHKQHEQQQQQHGGVNGVAPAGPEEEYLDGGSAGANGYGGGSSGSSLHTLAAPYHRGSAAALPGATTPPISGTVTPNGALPGVSGSPARRWRAGALLLPAPQLAAGATAVAALAAGAVATGWHLACTLLLLGEDRSAALLPAVILLAGGPGLAAGALARTLPARSGRAAGAWTGGALAGITALAAAVVVARARESAHMAAVARSYLYPNGATDTAEAMAGGALCAAAVLCFSAGTALKPRSTRGGALLGAAAALLLAGLRFALCSATPYCLSVHQLLLQEW